MKQSEIESILKTKFKIFNKQRTAVNAIEFIREFVKNNDCTIIVGTDSQISNGHINYVTAIALRMPKKGARVIYTITREPLLKEISMYQRLSTEALMSIEIVEVLANFDILVDKIELDCQKKPKAQKSNGIKKTGKPENMSDTVYNAYAGWIESLGIEVLAKPDSLMATVAADQLTR